MLHATRRPVDHGPQQDDFLVSPAFGAAGARVSIRLLDLPTATPILIGFGGIRTPHEILVTDETDADGTVEASVRIPDWVEAGHTYLFYMAYADQRPVRFSVPFLVTAPDGTVRVEGRVTDEGTSCLSMRGPQDELFTLTGAVEGLSPGDRVVVEARVSEASICMEGITLEVTTVEPIG